MATFLIRDFDDPRGYKEMTPAMGGLPRVAPGYQSPGVFQNGESYVPWGVTLDNRVVYARVGEHAGFRGGSGATRLLPYDTHISQKRRRLAESQLGVLALTWPHFTRNAVEKVSSGVLFYLNNRFFEKGKSETQNAVFDQIGHYFYTKGATGFGRISEADKATLGPEKVWFGILDALRTGKLEQQLAIHDAVGRKLLPKLGGDSYTQAYEKWGGDVREDWFEDKKRRGRIETEAQQKKQVKPTATPGIAAPGTKGTYNMPNVGQSRTRGVDSFARDLHRTREPNADAYYDDADVRNLLFGAGISGTTGTLLQAARAFGGITTGELMKQYVLAIIGYLVGGGMHSYHESMTIAQRVGVPYNPGAFLPSLPVSFIYSPQFASWRDQYYDIVVLGATHWRYNPGVIPSHLNRDLRTS
jgi:hypothetical protein